MRKLSHIDLIFNVYNYKMNACIHINETQYRLTDYQENLHVGTCYFHIRFYAIP